MSEKPTVAVIGASADPDKYGNKSIHAHLDAGYEVYPVTRRGGEIEGLKAFSSVEDIPVSLDRVTLYLPPTLGLEVIDAIARKGTKELFLNPGSESPELIEKAKSLGLSPILACSIVDARSR